MTVGQILVVRHTMVSSQKIFYMKIWLWSNGDDLERGNLQTGCPTIQREWDWGAVMIKDGKAYCGQSAVSRVIIYDICTAPAQLGPLRKPKWVIGHNSTHAMVIIMHFFGSGLQL